MQWTLFSGEGQALVYGESAGGQAAHDEIRRWAQKLRGEWGKAFVYLLRKDPGFEVGVIVCPEAN